MSLFCHQEHPKTFLPSPGVVNQFHLPGGLGIRVDSGLYSGYKIPPYYDSLIAKLVVHGKTREHCILRLKQALMEMIIEPIPSTLELHKKILDTDDMAQANYYIKWL